ncbi:YkgJ family cysteine cluster protein [Desulfosarcina sp. OttesenSCG-928-A07]|nr:YkgJ family cysteine cluster protein [Desulfosarcina sp. OttesenSCG-928-G17]MDL2330312.1 YkgJ family cysteine cluster protein [Desulfosarcina sp. OttesenSCG-928-A07]
MASDTDQKAPFTCTLCGDCCKGFGGTYLSDGDMDAISGYLEMPKDELVRQYTQPSGKSRVIAQGKDGRCVFWNQLCTIHPVKPWMCRQWPFIPGVLADVNNWRAMAGSCPGINTTLTDREILDAVQKNITPKPLR